jgi:hypothetical protein
MISEQQYNDALILIKEYRKQKTIVPPYAVKSCLYPNYFISKRGEVWKETGYKVNVRVKQNNKTGRKQLVVSINNNSIGLATIIATQFVKQPNGYNRIHFKDNDPTNCSAENLCWLNNELTYISTKLKHPDTCPMGKGMKKIFGNANISATKVKCDYLKKYYLSGNEKYLQQCWNNIDNQMTFKGWNEVKSECYIYFIDRCKRFSLTGNPIAYMLVMGQKIYKGNFKTLNTSKAKESKKIDESLIIQKY